MSVGLICGSVLLNFRMAYRAADTEIDAWVYGVSAGLADGLKALMPFVVAIALARRNWFAVGLASTLFLIISAYSFTAAIGFAAQHRMTKATERLEHAERYHDLRQRYSSLQQTREKLGTQRAPTIIREERTTLLLTPIPGRQTVAELSANCTLNRGDAVAICENWRHLGVELTSALEAQRIDSELQELRIKLDAVPAVSTAEDPQTVAISRLGQWFEKTFPQEDIQLGLSLLLALVIEAGSGFGLYLTATLRGRREGEEGDTVAAVHHERLGNVDDYAMARLEPSPGGTLTLTALYEDYRHWCRDSNLVALAKPPFEAGLTDLARDVGIVQRTHGSETAYADVKIIV
jgi:hypothetical protein